MSEIVNVSEYHGGYFCIEGQRILWDEVPKMLAKKIIHPQWIEDIKKILYFWFSDEEIFIVKTSGSTIQKEIKLHKKYMIESAYSTINTLKLTKTMTALLCLPANFIGGIMVIVRALILKMNLICQKPSLNPFVTLTAPIHIVSLTVMQTLKNISVIPQNCIVLIGGSEVPHHLHKVLNSLDIHVIETFGMSETYSHVAMKNISKKETRFHALEGNYFSQDGRDCLCITNQRLGLFNFMTNDIVKLHNNKEFTYLGRYDNIINTGGIKVNPEIIESKIAFLFNRKFIICGIPSLALGSEIVLVLEGEKVNDEEKLLKKCGFILPKYYKPRKIYYFEKFPLPIRKHKENKFNRKFIICGIPSLALGSEIVLVLEGEKVNDEEKLLKKCGFILPKYYKPRKIYYFEKFPITDSDPSENTKKTNFY